MTTELTIGQLHAALSALRAEIVAEEHAHRLGEDPRLINLGHYLALRHRDVRPLQRQLTWRGLSSLGRLESRVVPTLDATIAALDAMRGAPLAHTPQAEAQFFAGEEALESAVTEIFGAGSPPRRTRIMVTLAGEFATDPAPIAALVAAGMDVARINCAHDNAPTWIALADAVRAAARHAGRDVRVLMDLAGPKIRTSDIAVAVAKSRMHVGDGLRLHADQQLVVDATAAFAARVAPDEVLQCVRVGDRVRYNDGQMEGHIEAVDDRSAVLRINAAKPAGAKLKPEKGLNFPDSDLTLSPLTEKDIADLEVVGAHADMVGYSFVSRPEDLARLDGLVPVATSRGAPFGLVAKIERPEAVRNLPRLIAQALGRRPFAVMIARGDLAAEIGFERLAEMQEEILWICEAASVPVVWATQVLEGLVSEGLPSRGEMTDAAMAARAECVMLNKGPYIAEGLATLGTVVSRMEGHLLKKTATLRRLESW